MDRKIAFIYLVLIGCCFFFASSLKAYELENFSWGESRSSVVSKLKRKGWQRQTTSSSQTLETDGTLLGEPCHMKFSFNQSLALTSLEVVWKKTGSGEAFYRSIVNRYGPPDVSNPGLKHYEWEGSFKGERISLDYRDYLDNTLKTEATAIFTNEQV